MKQTGQILREQREKLGLTIHEISLALKINSRIIKAMEEGNSSQLPPRTFLRGFVQSYGAYLKTDIDKLMETFQEETEPVKKEMAEPTSSSVPQQAAASPSVWHNFLFWNGSSSKTTSVAIGGVALVIVALIVVVSKTINKYQQESQVVPVTEVQSIDPKNTDLAGADEESVENQDGETAEPTSSVAGVSEKAEADKKTTDMSRDAASDATLSLTPVPVSSPKAPADDTKVVQVIKPETPVEKAPETKPQTKPAEIKPVGIKPAETKPAETKPAEIQPAKVVAEPKPAEVKPEAPKKEAETAQELIVEALDKLSVEVQIDGGAAQNFTLNPDQIRTIKAKKSLKVKLSDGGAVSLIYNGKDTGVPGDLGKPLQLTYPK